MCAGSQRRRALPRALDVQPTRDRASRRQIRPKQARRSKVICGADVERRRNIGHSAPPRRDQARINYFRLPFPRIENTASIPPCLVRPRASVPSAPKPSSLFLSAPDSRTERGISPRTPLCGRLPSRPRARRSPGGPAADRRPRSCLPGRAVGIVGYASPRLPGPSSPPADGHVAARA